MRVAPCRVRSCKHTPPRQVQEPGWRVSDTAADPKPCVEAIRAYCETGSLQHGQAEKWAKAGCLLTKQSLAQPVLLSIPVVQETHVEAHLKLSNRTQPRIVSRTTVAITVASTSRYMEDIVDKDVSQHPLFLILFPSLVASLETSYAFRLYVAFDDDDGFITKPSLASYVRRESAELEKEAAKVGVSLEVIILSFNNPWHAPGPVFNFMCGKAYKDGADFIYRINDDTGLKTPYWATAYIKHLKSYDPPLVGVVGPYCNRTRKYLTHDFVHRTHMEIFRVYYPTMFTTWYMDLWIDRVYGGFRTSLLKGVEVLHDNEWSEGGTRYDPVELRQSTIFDVISEGSRQIDEWVRTRNSTRTLAY